MANFGLIGYVKSVMKIGNRCRMTIGEYVQGRRLEDGTIDGEKMDLWYVFFPSTSLKHVLRFKPHDLVIVKGTIHLTGSKEYPYAINGETIKHFYTRDLIGDIKRESESAEMLSRDGEIPNPESMMFDEFG